MTTVTIIVAVHDVAPYLDACVNSVLGQSHADLEVLLVDDGSTDESGGLCDLFAARDPRVRVIHRANGGLSAARNTGLRDALGEFVAFLDGDDWMDSGAVRSLVDAAGDNTDLVVAGIYVDTEDTSGAVIQQRPRVPVPAIVTNGIASGPLLADGNFVNLLGYAWNKLYRRKLLVENHLEFEEGLQLVEDVVFNGCVFDVAKQVVFVNEAGVHYMQRPRATLGTFMGPDLLDLRLRAMGAVQGILERCGIEDQDRRDASTSMALITLKSMVLAQKGRQLGRAWSATRLMMHGDAYHTLMRSFPALKTLPAQERLWVLLFRCGLAPLLSVTSNGRHRLRSFSVVPLRPRLTREGGFTNLRKLQVRTRLRLALPWARADTAVRTRKTESPHVYVGLAADYGNLGDLAITHAQVKFLEKEFPDAVIEPIPISRTLNAIKRLREVIRDEDIVTLVGGGNTGDLYDDIQYLREMYVTSFPRNRIISFPQTIEFSDTFYGTWAAKRASRVYNSHPDLIVMARDSASYRRATALFSECKVVLSPDVVLTLSENAGDDTRDGVLAALRSDLERGLSAEDHDIVLAVTRTLGDTRERDTHIGDVRLTAEEARTELELFWAECRNSRVVVTDRLHGMVFALITGTPCLALDSGTSKVSRFYRDWLQDIPTVRLLDKVQGSELRQALVELNQVGTGGHPAHLADRFTEAFVRGVGQRDGQ